MQAITIPAAREQSLVFFLAFMDLPGDAGTPQGPVAWISQATLCSAMKEIGIGNFDGAERIIGLIDI